VESCHRARKGTEVLFRHQFKYQLWYGSNWEDVRKNAGLKDIIKFPALSGLERAAAGSCWLPREFVPQHSDCLESVSLASNE